MTLVERIQAVKEKGQAHYDSDRVSASYSDMEDMANYMADALKNLKEATRLYKALADHDAVDSFDVSPLYGYLKDAEKGLTRKKFKDTKADDIKHETQILQSEMNAKWVAYVESQISDARNIVKSVESFVEGRTEYQKMISSNPLAYGVIPGSQDAFKKIEEYLEHFKKLMVELNLSPAVKNFIDKLNEGKTVSLKDLDNETLEELRTSQFADKLKIVIRA